MEPISLISGGCALVAAGIAAWAAFAVRRCSQVPAGLFAMVEKHRGELAELAASVQASRLQQATFLEEATALLEAVETRRRRVAARDSAAREQPAAEPVPVTQADQIVALNRRRLGLDRSA